jgi:UDP-N-acetylmuramoyl-L-alanine---L-glutamate ligase
VLNALGKKSFVLGNIGTPVTEGAQTDGDFFVVEVSSYQAANLTENIDLAVLTSLFPEHLDWHKSLENYYRDKSNLLSHAKIKIVESAALQTLKKLHIDFENAIVFNAPDAFHFNGAEVLHGPQKIGALGNAFLLRAHNRGNVCAVLAAVDALGLDPAAALKAMKDYRGLPHRQSELGEKDGVLYVDDSISTTPQSAIAAMEAYDGKSITLIAGGFDRGIDYEPLVAYVLQKKINAVVCLGDSGRRIFEGLRQSGFPNALLAASMREAVSAAKHATLQGGVILLSPAAPSYGMFKDFVDRAAHFAKESGF